MALRFEFVSVANDSLQPHARSGHRLVADDTNLYALGGYNPDLVDEDEEDIEEIRKCICVQMFKFNFTNLKWKEMEMTGDVPVHLASHSASLVGRVLFTYGGSGIPFGIEGSRDVHMCTLHPKANTVHWKRMAVTGARPQKKYGHGQVVGWPYLYLVGGTEGTVYNCDVHRLDLQTWEWVCLFDSYNSGDKHAPMARYRHEVLIHENKIFMLGGGLANVSFGLDKVFTFDLDKLKWQELPTRPDLVQARNYGLHDSKSYPGPRRCHSCVHYGNAAYVFGGRDMEIHGDLWRLCLDSLQWDCLVRKAPVECFFHGAAVNPSGCMFVFGGVTLPDADGEEERINDIHRVWLVVPPLAELAWSGICRRLPTSAQDSGAAHLSSQLLEHGVPANLVQRYFDL